MALSKGARLAIVAGVVVVLAAGAAAVLFWPRGTGGGAVAGAGKYARELAACQRGLFDAEIRGGNKIEYLPDTVWHQVQGERMNIGGQAIMPTSAGGTMRVRYECDTVQGDLVNSFVRPVQSGGTNLNRNLN